MKPATSSDSASTRSKGGRFVSASAEMKKMMNIGNSDSQCQSRKVLGRPSLRAEPVLLRQDDVGQVQRADAEQHGDDDEADRDFVGHHLRRRAQRAEERVFRVRRPAAHDDAVDVERGDGEDVEDADIDVGDRPSPGRAGSTAQAESASTADTSGASRNTPLLAPAGIIGSLKTNFRQVGEGLQQAEGTDDVRAAAQLHGRPDLAVG